METYIKQINKLFSTQASRSHFLGVRLCQKELTHINALILGINPSNSIQAFKRRAFKQAIAAHHELPQEILNQQVAYDDFLCFENSKDNHDLICLLENLSHRHHPHFQKHHLFAKALGIADKSMYWDLYPIWEIEQANLLKKLKQNPVLSQQLIAAFTDLLIRNSQIKTLYFFNSGAYETFMKQIILDSRICYSEVKQLNLKVGRQKPSKIKKSVLTVNGKRQLEMIGFGIGSYSFGSDACLQLAETYKNTL